LADTALAALSSDLLFKLLSTEGSFKFVKPTGNVYGLLKITRLDCVFDIEPEEATAIRSLRLASSATSGG
jgi:hypothetical protein